MILKFFPSRRPLPTPAQVREESSPEQLSVWWRQVRLSRSTYLFEAFALNAATPPVVLSAVYRHPLTPEPVRALVLLHADCPPRLLAHGAVSRSEGQRHAAAQNPSTPAAQLSVLCTEVYYDVAECAVRNPSTPTRSMLVPNLVRVDYLRALVIEQLTARADGYDALVAFLISKGLLEDTGVDLPFDFLLSYLPR